MSLLPPPQDINAEKALLGSCLIDTVAARWSSQNVPQEAFYGSGNADIARAIYSLLEANVGIDIISVGSALRESGKLAEVGGPDYLKQCQDAVGTASYFQHYGHIVLKLYYDREIIHCGINITSAIHSSDQDAIDDAIKRLDDLHRLKGGVGEVKALALKDTMMGIMCAIDESREPDIIRFRLGNIDNILGGTVKGRLTTFGARPRIGKTAAMATVGINMAKDGKRVGYLSGEMTGEEVSARILSAHSGVQQWRIARRKLEKGHIQSLRDSASELAALPFFFEQTNSPSLEDIRRFAERMSLDVIIVDYLTRCRLPKAESQRVSVNKFMVGIKNLARDGYAVILGAQVNRNADREADRAPLLSDLKESSAIEEESDAVILLHSKRDDLDNQSLDSIEVQFHVAKNRHGKMGKDVIMFHRDTLRLGENRQQAEPQDFKMRAAGSDIENWEVPF